MPIELNRESNFSMKKDLNLHFDVEIEVLSYIVELPRWPHNRR
jgi:hypothetical protein